MKFLADMGISPETGAWLTSPPAKAGRFFAFYTNCSLVLRSLRELHER
jgi:hypothetical protein